MSRLVAPKPPPPARQAACDAADRAAAGFIDALAGARPADGDWDEAARLEAVRVVSPPRAPARRSLARKRIRLRAIRTQARSADERGMQTNGWDVQLMVSDLTNRAEPSRPSPPPPPLSLYVSLCLSVSVCV